jgi:hypothetical protein
MPHQRRGPVQVHALARQDHQLAPPGGPGIRVDSHVYNGYTVPPHYDSMIGKLIAYGDTREQAIRRMRIALSEMMVEGIKTNIPLHQDLMLDPRFIEGRHQHPLPRAQARRPQRSPRARARDVDLVDPAGRRRASRGALRRADGAGAISVSDRGRRRRHRRETPQFGEPGHLPSLWDHSRVIALFDPRRPSSAASPRRAAAGLDAVPPFIHREVAEQNWVQLTQSQFDPIRITDRLWIVPSWHAGARRRNAINIELDPGMAFGTGSHPTTRLCLEWLCEASRRAAACSTTAAARASSASPRPSSAPVRCSASTSTTRPSRPRATTPPQPRGACACSTRPCRWATPSTSSSPTS